MGAEGQEVTCTPVPECAGTNCITYQSVYVQIEYFSTHNINGMNVHCDIVTVNTVWVLYTECWDSRAS